MSIVERLPVDKYLQRRNVSLHCCTLLYLRKHAVVALNINGAN